MDSYICIDLETTGLNPKCDKIIEIGAVKVLQGEVVSTYSTFVYPGRKLDARVTELTGITDSDLQDAPQLDAVFPIFLEYAEDLPLLGHSLLFDYSFLKKAAVDRKLSFERSGIDTLKIARKYLADLESRNLGYLCRHYSIRHNAHRALGDAQATVELYQKLVDAFYTEEDGLFVPSPQIYKVKRDQPAGKMQKEKLYQLQKQHNIALDVDIEMLTRSEASRLTDVIYATYGRN